MTRLEKLKFEFALKHGYDEYVLAFRPKQEKHRQFLETIRHNLKPPLENKKT